MKKNLLFKMLAVLIVLVASISTAWAGQGYNGESHVYLNVNGTTKYYKVSTESWSTGSSLPGTWGGVLKDQTFNKVLNIQVKGGAVGGWTENGGNISGNLYYKVTNNTTTPSSGWTTVGNINANYTTKSGNNCFRYKNDYSVNVTPTTPGTYYLHIKITDGDSNNRTSYVKIVVPSFTVAGTSAVLGSDWDVTDTNNDMTFSSGTTYTLTKSNVTLATGTTYECKVALDHSWGTSYPGSNKTFTVAANGQYNVTFSFDASNQSVSVSTTRLYAVIYNDNGKTSGSVPATSYHANGATVTVASNSGSLAKTGYTFGGWNTNSSGTGTNYTDGSGTFTMGSADKNLFAKWTENMSTVSFVASPTGKGTFQVNSSTVTSTTAGVTTTRSVTAVPISSYHFVSWSISGGATINSTTANPVTVTGKGAGAAATLTATFAADDVYTLTVATGTGISDVTGTTNNIKAGDNIAITATVAPGYTWSTWTKTGAGTLSTFTAGTRNQTVTVGTAGDITLTASATETMRTITIIGGTAASTTAGVSTTGSATAAEPAAGKKFTGWTLGSGVTLSGGALTDRTINFTATANSSVTANYADRAGVKMYFAKPSSWSKVHAYAWNTGNTSQKNKDWPGIELSTTEDINCVTYYVYQYYTEADGIGGDATGNSAWNGIIFSENGSNQTPDLTISNGHYYYKTSTTTGSETAIPSAWYVKGDFNSFGETDALTPNCGANTATKTIELTTGNKEFKIYNAVNDQWWRITGNITATQAATTMNNNGGNMTLTPSVAGNYVFTVGSTNSTPTLAVTYPTTYTVTYSVSPSDAANAVTTSPSFSSGAQVLSGTSVTFTHQTAKTGYTWKGWYNNTSGTGDALGTDNTYTTTISAATQVYAVYTENQYNATVSAGSNGSVSPSGTVAIKQATGTSITATPNTGYSFSSWSISGGGITPTTSSTSPQTFKATSAGGSITANFSENTYTVSVNRNNNAFGTVSTSSVSGVGISTISGNITATPETGATFTGWTLPSGVTAAEGYTSSSNPIKINATASGKAITANFSETKYTATINTANASYGTVSPSSASVGQITAVQISASKKTGYMFAGWVKTAGTGTVTYHVAAGTGKSVDATGNTQATTYITIDGNVTLQATWDEDRTSGWYMRGNWTNGWDSGQKEFVKDVGETAGTVSHVRWTLSPEMFTDATMQMKMFDGTDFYGHWNGDEASQNLCTKDANNTNIGFYKDTGGDPHSNFRISIPVAGEYDFEWDSSTKQLTVHYPAGNFIRGGFNSWGWEHPLEPTGNANEYSCVISMTGDNAPHSFTGDNGFKVVIAGDHYGKNSTTITRGSNSASSLTTSGANINLTTDVRGDYTFTVNSSSKTVTITYPNAYTVTFGSDGHGTVTASATSVGGSFSSGAYVASGDVVTFSQTPAGGYTFKGWYTDATGSTSAGLNGSNQLTINANKTVYAQYNPTTYTNVILDKTIGSTNGAYSVTFGGTSITVTTTPTKTGYQPEGYYESYANSTWTNKIATSAGALQNNTTYTDVTGHWTSTASPTLYTKWQACKYDIVLNDNNGGSHNGSAKATYDSNTLSNISAPTKTGYSVEGYYQEAAKTHKIATDAGALQPSTSYTTSGSLWNSISGQTLYAKWTANKYDVTLKANGGSGADKVVTATYDAGMPSTLKGGGALTAHTRTGYNLLGYWDDASAGNKYYNYSAGTLSSSQTWNKTTTANLYAHWQAKTTTLSFVNSGTGYGSGGQSATMTATYDADMPTTISVPTAANGYAFMGYYDALEPLGTQYYTSTGASARTWNKDTETNTNLYAYFKKAEITNVALSATTVAPGASITVTPTIAPNPEGTKIVCYKLLYSDGNEHASQPTFTPGAGNSATFTVPAESGSYKISLTLHTGTDCDAAGTELDTKIVDFIVAGDHTVTIQYKCGDYTIQPSTTNGGTPLDWTTITAPDLTGYTFTKWKAGDGITIEGADENGEKASEEIRYKASYDGTLTANYTKRRVIYFYNTLGWSDVYVYFYKNNSYWGDSNQGTGAHDSWYGGAYVSYGRMLPITEGSSIYYFDAQTANVDASYTNVAFTELDQHGCDYFYNSNKVVRRDDYNATSLPMFVPLADQQAVHMNSNTADYYNKGYWMNYPENTGYTLKIYNDPYANKSTGAIHEYPFPFSADKKMPLKLDVEFNTEGSHLWFMVYRNDGIHYGRNYTLHQNHHPDMQIYGNNNDKPEIMISAPGVYTFTLTYHADGSSNFDYYINIDFPISENDYRIDYTDNATWSQGSAHAAGWHHPSDVIRKNTNAEVTQYDTVSFYIAKGTGITTSMKFQYVSEIASNYETHESTVKWSNGLDAEHTSSEDYTIDLSDFSSVITTAGVYNFIVKQVGTAAPVLEKVEPYTGTFYIRTDCAGNTKWDAYKTNDHQMQFSEYTKAKEGFTHYYAHWVDRGTNVRFVIANDYSPYISDTLVQDVDIDFKNMDATGTLKSDGSGQAYQDRFSANIRFMYNEATNKLSRAYLASSTDVSKKFLVLRGNGNSGVGHIYNASGQELTGGGKIYGLDDYEMNFQDDQNFIYETTIKANPTALVKLYAKYCGRSQEFKGDTTATFTKDVTAIEILGGSYAADTKESMRIVYDFKTNRLVCAWLPSESAITGNLEINADVMIIREHQEDAKQITFNKVSATDPQLSEVKNVYGVMRFNRWTLANRSKTGSHDPLPDGEVASAAERQLYFISFPFDVNLGDIFGLGTYDDLWWIMYYDGEARARECFWAESKGFWKFLENTPGQQLKANKGYLLTLSKRMFDSGNTNIWANNIERVELFFPSAAPVSNIHQDNVTVSLEAYTCTETRDNRNLKDSHWHCMGVPSYANYDKNVTDGSGAISWRALPWSAGNITYLYNWNKVDNTLTAHTANNYNFQSMNAYMVQYTGNVVWTATSVPNSVAARRNAAYKSVYEFRLELQKDGAMTDQAFVSLRDDDNVTAAFDFNYDLSKEGSTRSVIYTVTGDNIPVAGNCLPLDVEHTKIVPVGVVAKTSEEFTFAMPDGTDGMVVTLIDNETNMHTNLAIGQTYTVALKAGTYEGRFSLEIDPRNAPTTIDIIGGESEDIAPRKVFINGLMYILRGNNVYDANGRKLE